MKHIGKLRETILLYNPTSLGSIPLASLSYFSLVSELTKGKYNASNKWQSMQNLASASIKVKINNLLLNLDY